MKFVKDIFEALSKHILNPKVELDYTNNYTLLVAVVLSAQSTDKGVNKATKDLFAKVSTPLEMLEFGEDNLIDAIKTIGLFKNKAKNIIGLSKILIERFNSCVPDNIEDLTSLPGVGRKTANVVLNTAFGKDAIPVDTHVLRVSKRLGFTSSSNPLKVEMDLLKIVPDEFKHDASNLLVLHGRYTCKAKKPMCEGCVIVNNCKFFKDVNCLKHLS